MQLKNAIVGHGEEPPDALLANPFNYRQHPPWQRAALLAQMREVGWIQRVIVNQRSGHLIDGHLRVELALARGEPAVPVLYVDLDDAQERLALATLDPLSALAEPDQGMLNELLAGLPAYDDPDLAALLADLAGAQALDEEPEPDPRDDDAPAPPVEPISQPGDLWLLGDPHGAPHRVLCGDGTRLDEVERLTAGRPIDLVWTDPPYNVDYESHDGQKIQNDAMSDGAFRQFLRDLFSSAAAVTRAGGPIYVAHADSEGYNFRGALTEAGWLLKQCLIWVKDGADLGRQDYQWQHESILYGWKPGAAHRWYGDHDKKTVLDDEPDPRTLDKAALLNEVRRLRNARNTSVVREHRTRHNQLHPTMKPVALIVHQIRNSSRPGDAVLDLCGGSGSTLIACEKTRRQAHLMELDPRYCDVIVRRVQELTGQAAVLEGSGQSFAALSAAREAPGERIGGERLAPALEDDPAA